MCCKGKANEMLNVYENLDLLIFDILSPPLIPFPQGEGRDSEQMAKILTG